ncbi:ROK family protein [Actinomadura flavalba]|uniref:ROK family protein n=1 Tax=Actinomadura flavalba TaxID=1120938 RepID=UPI00037DA0F9|nr:ROK family protein [Actinomadura flavalba]
MTVAALDVGGTTMKGSVLSASGAELFRLDRPTPRADPVAGVLALAAELAAAVPGVRAVGLAVPGLVDDASGTAVRSVNLGWRDVPLRALAAARLGLPVAVGHDVRLGGLAEAERGGGDFLFVPIGTGIAAALVLDGAPYAGAAGWSGELGHLVVRPGGEPCACGAAGCLEAYASGAALERRGGAPAAEVIARAARGDRAAARVWSEALDALADALAHAVVLLDPSRIVLAGGVAQAADALTVPITTRLASRLTVRPAPPLTTTPLGPRAAVHGAALLAHRL